MKSGNIFVDKEGADIEKIEVAKRNEVIRDYYVMRERAKSIDDKFFFINSQEWETFYANLWSPDNPYWNGIEMNYIISLQNGAFPQKMIDDIAEFDALPEPKSHGGYRYDYHPSTNYIHDMETWREWHTKWNLDHLDDKDSDPLYNAIWPRFDRIIDILRQELLKAGKNVPSNENEIVNSFYEQVMKHLNERERISVSKRIGAAICEANYYQREVELEKLEADHGNKHAERIYSIKIGTNYQFLSIDKQHGMLELCNDKGDHQIEKRFDGTNNKYGDANHSLFCVREWKQKYNK